MNGRHTMSNSIDGGSRPATASAGHAARSVAGAPKRVLIADDSAPIRETLTSVLRDLGHEVQSAPDGDAALKMAQAWLPEFVLIDVYMPKVNGFVVARSLRNRYPASQMKLIMMSGAALDEATLTEAGDAGFDHCIDKAFTIDALNDLLSGGFAQDLQAEQQDRKPR
jgi:CheY-like chemotaxis protein